MPVFSVFSESGKRWGIFIAATAEDAKDQARARHKNAPRELLTALVDADQAPAVDPDQAPAVVDQAPAVDPDQAPAVVDQAPAVDLAPDLIILQVDPNGSGFLIWSGNAGPGVRGFTGLLNARVIVPWESGLAEAVRCWANGEAEPFDAPPCDALLSESSIIAMRVA